jgi:hypothetical protein
MDPNSAFNWLERWTISRVWKPISQPKRAGIDAKPHTRKASYAMETESAKLKRNARKSSVMLSEPSQTNTVIETEKTERIKRNPRRFTSRPADPVPDAQLTELEKVKHSLRKVSNSMADASKSSNTAAEVSEHQEVHCERPPRNSQKIQAHPENQEPQNGNLSDNGKMDTTVPDLQPGAETVSHPVTNEEINEPAIVSPAAEIMPLQDINSEENALVNDVEQRSKEDPLSSESLKSSKRRSSFSAKAEYPENGSKNSPALPSYMAATKSAKAKLRGQISPRLGSDSAEKNGYTRRHSLPSSTNGKLNSQSPRTQRPTHSGGKDAVKSDKSMISSRDATGK